MHRLDWCYPAFMVALGAHYLPFVFLYGMQRFGLLAFGLVTLGLAMSQRTTGGWADPAWIMGAVLPLFSAAGWIVVRRDGRAAAV